MYIHEQIRSRRSFPSPLPILVVSNFHKSITVVPKPTPSNFLLLLIENIRAHNAEKPLNNIRTIVTKRDFTQIKISFQPDFFQFHCPNGIRVTNDATSPYGK